MVKSIVKKKYKTRTKPVLKCVCNDYKPNQPSYNVSLFKGSFIKLLTTILTKDGKIIMVDHSVQYKKIQ